MKKLFDSFIFKNDVTLLYGPTNVGKSILAVQIGDAIARGASALEFLNESPALKVLYFDFELDKKQFKNRYPAGSLSDNFYRIDKSYFEKDESIFAPFENEKNSKLSEFTHGLRDKIRDKKFKFIILDNIMAFSDYTGLTKPMKLIKYFKSLSNKYKTTVLIVGHTKKITGRAPILLENLYGDSRLGNFLDAAFVINKSIKRNIYYLKQSKVRNGIFNWDEDLVAELKLDSDKSMLAFKRTGSSPEIENLMDSFTKRAEQHLKIYKKYQVYIHLHGYKTFATLAPILNVPESTLWRICKTFNSFEFNPQEYLDQEDNLNNIF